MKIQGSTDVAAVQAAPPNSSGAAKAGDEKTENIRKDGDNVVIQGSMLNLGGESIEEKKKKAQSMALKLIEQAFSGDQKIDDEIKKHNDIAKTLEEDNAEHKKILHDIDNEMENAKEIYNIDPEGQEEADYQVLKKQQRYQMDPDNNPELTLEEEAQANYLKKRGLTEYQDKMLKLDQNRFEYEQKIHENEKNIQQAYGTVRGIQLERLKYHEMTDAVKQGDAIIAAANKEIMGTIMGDAMDNIEKTQEEDKEEADQIKEEKEELEEKIEDAREERKKQEEENLEIMYELGETLDKVTSGGDSDTMPKLKKSLNQIVNELQLTNEDLKGAVVDEKQ